MDPRWDDMKMNIKETGTSEKVEEEMVSFA